MPTSNSRTINMGLYRLLVGIYYSKKNIFFIGLTVCTLMTVYLYLPVHHKYGTHYLNPRLNMEVVKPHVAFQPKDDENPGEDGSNINELNLKPVPEFITERSKCPACFGEDICPHIDSGAIKILVPDDDNDVLKLKGVYNGYWNDQPVVIKRLNKPEEYAKVDAYLCQNVGMAPDCDVSKAILEDSSVVQSDEAIKPEFLRTAWKIMHDRSDKLPVVACITEDAISKLSREFDANDDGVLSKEEKAQFFMSLVFNPESLFLTFAKTEGLKIHFPEVLGRCGRIVVTEHAGVPLASFLDRPFKERADLALMLFGMIFFLQNFSTKWSLVFSDFNFDNLYVKDYNMYIVDAEEMLVTDMEVYKESRDWKPEVCNYDCMEQFARRLFDYDHVKREEVCPMTPRITELAMYSLACERIMSFLPEHRTYSPFQGLLHDPPEEAMEILESSLRDCVTETRPEGRISSVDVLSEMLEKFTDYNDYDFSEEYQGGQDGGNLEQNELPAAADDQSKDQADAQQAGDVQAPVVAANEAGVAGVPPVEPAGQQVAVDQMAVPDNNAPVNGVGMEQNAAPLEQQNEQVPQGDVVVENVAPQAQVLQEAVAVDAANNQQQDVVPVAQDIVNDGQNVQQLQPAGEAPVPQENQQVIPPNELGGNGAPINVNNQDNPAAVNVPADQADRQIL